MSTSVERAGLSPAHLAAVMQKEAQAAHYYINALEEHIAIYENAEAKG